MRPDLYHYNYEIVNGPTYFFQEYRGNIYEGYQIDVNYTVFFDTTEVESRIYPIRYKLNDTDSTKIALINQMGRDFLSMFQIQEVHIDETLHMVGDAMVNILISKWDVFIQKVKDMENPTIELVDEAWYEVYSDVPWVDARELAKLVATETGDNDPYVLWGFIIQLKEWL